MVEKEAMYYEKKGNNVQCQLCPHFCFLMNNQIGKCRVRKNFMGKLVSLVYARPCSLAIDPIEKKPLYHFLPGKKTLSLATQGCNFKCGFCQNWQISQASWPIKTLEVKPEEIIKEAVKEKLRIISYTYTEPTIFYEYMLDIAKLAKKKRIKNVTVTNGFINPEPLNELCNYLDASNIDLKSFDQDFYERVCKANLKPVLESIKIMKEKGVWIELTNLIIPGLNDSVEKISKLVDWVEKNLGKDVPLHFSAFFPQYKITNLPPTNPEILKKARRIAIGKGLKYVYTGNIYDEEGNNTYCPGCHKLLVKRRYYSIIENNINKGRCKYCHEKIAGVWS